MVRVWMTAGLLRSGRVLNDPGSHPQGQGWPPPEGIVSRHVHDCTVPILNDP